MRSVVLITTGQPSVNPRVVKEANAFQAAGFSVTLVYCFWIKWAAEADVLLLKNSKWKSVLAGGSPDKNKVLYFYTKARNKFNNAVNKKLGNGFLCAERSQARCYDEMLKAAESTKADWYIAHNLGALSIAVKAAERHRALAGFDFEDYHREENYNTPLHELKRIIYLEEKYVPQLKYISTSSPLISARVTQNFPFFFNPIITVLNCFPFSRDYTVTNGSNPAGALHLFWFSQTVGRNRGLETVILALGKLNNPHIQLTLAGRLDEEMKEYLNAQDTSIKQSVHLSGIVQPEDLPALAGQFDVGLATELTTPLNRDICLTNKIFTYILAGNCIVASATSAQKDFMNLYPGIGLLYTSNDPDDLARQIDLLFHDRRFLKSCRLTSLQLAATRMNWEVESSKLLDVLDTFYA